MEKKSRLDAYIEKHYANTTKKVEVILEDSFLLDKIVKAAYKKLEDFLEKYIDIKDKIEGIAGIIFDWRMGNYKDISVKNLTIGVMALLYFISPYDAIPDFLPFIGKQDDRFILKKFISYLDTELDKYNKWKSSE